MDSRLMRSTTFATQVDLQLWKQKVTDGWWPTCGTADIAAAELIIGFAWDLLNEDLVLIIILFFFEPFFQIENSGGWKKDRRKRKTQLLRSIYSPVLRLFSNRYEIYYKFPSMLLRLTLNSKFSSWNEKFFPSKSKCEFWWGNSNH